VAGRRRADHLAIRCAQPGDACPHRDHLHGESHRTVWIVERCEQFAVRLGSRVESGRSAELELEPISASPRDRSSRLGFLDHVSRHARTFASLGPLPYLAAAAAGAARVPPHAARAGTPSRGREPAPGSVCSTPATSHGHMPCSTTCARSPSSRHGRNRRERLRFTAPRTRLHAADFRGVNESGGFLVTGAGSSNALRLDTPPTRSRLAETAATAAF
jgi:hypothetical protein